MSSSETGPRGQETGGGRPSPVEQAKSDAGRLSEAARSRTVSYLEERKSQLAGNVVGVANAAREAADRIDAQGSPLMADYVYRAAEGLERFSEVVRHRELSAWMEEVEDFARRQPAVFIGAGVAVGFVLARVLKSSSERRESERHEYRGEHGSQAPSLDAGASENRARQELRRELAGSSARAGASGAGSSAGGRREPRNAADT